MSLKYVCDRCGAKAGPHQLTDHHDTSLVEFIFKDKREYQLPDTWTRLARPTELERPHRALENPPPRRWLKRDAELCGDCMQDLVNWWKGPQDGQAD